MALDQLLFPESSQKGFTLLEILVALAVFALAASVLLVTDGRAIRQTARIQEMVQASWLADRELNRYYIENLWPDIGKHGDSVNASGRDWYLRHTVSATSQQGLRRLEINVFPGSGKPSDSIKPVYRLTGYVRRPPE